ncbi:MAG: NADH-quinone oxidoreductase subunit B [Candidatus Hodarchaeales archaeon]|jgi:NADH-quinone oxidoreductase subunit B
MSKMKQLKGYFRNSVQKTWGIKKECKELGELEIYEPMPNVVVTNSRNFVTVIINWLRNWSQRASLYTVYIGMKCCAMEMGAAMASRYDTQRLGILARASPRHCDVLWVNGPVSVKFAPRLRDVFDQMPAPKWVFATGECAISGGPFWQAPTILEGTDQVVPVVLVQRRCGLVFIVSKKKLELMEFLFLNHWLKNLGSSMTELLQRQILDYVIMI